MEKSLKRHEHIMLRENIAMVDWFSFVSIYSVNQIRELISVVTRGLLWVMIDRLRETTFSLRLLA